MLPLFTIEVDARRERLLTKCIIFVPEGGSAAVAEAGDRTFRFGRVFVSYDDINHIDKQISAFCAW